MNEWNYETDFTATIFKDDEKYFTRKGIDPVEDYNNTTIKVTGELQKYDGCCGGRLLMDEKSVSELKCPDRHKLKITR